MRSMSYPMLVLGVLAGCTLICGGSSCSAKDDDVEFVVVNEPVLPQTFPAPSGITSHDYTIESYEVSEAVSDEGIVHRELRAITLVDAPPARDREEVLTAAEEILAANPDLAGLPEGSGRFAVRDVVSTSEHDVVVFTRETFSGDAVIEGRGAAHYLFDEDGYIEEITLYFQLP